MVTPKPTERKSAAQEVAAACVDLLKSRFAVRKVYVFGSAAGDGPWHSRSDLDLAVEGLAPEEYVRALAALCELLPEGLELDLITLEDAPAALAARIKGEVKMPEDPQLALKKEINDELINLRRIVDQSATVLDAARQKTSFLEVNAAGKLVHDFYGGVERIFERIAVRLGPGLPVGYSWHTLLLRSMESEAERIRPPVIDHELALDLLDLLRFRHFFRHTYGYELRWEKIEPLLRDLPKIQKRLRHQLETFLSSIVQLMRSGDPPGPPLPRAHALAVL